MFNTYKPESSIIFLSFIYLILLLNYTTSTVLAFQHLLTKQSTNEWNMQKNFGCRLWKFGFFKESIKYHRHLNTDVPCALDSI